MIDLIRLADTPDGRAEFVAESDRRAAAYSSEQKMAAQRHQIRLAELVATGRPINPNFTGITGIANLAAEDAAWAPGAGLERIARMEYDLAPGVREMNAAQLREFVESGAAEAWRAGEVAKLPPQTDGPFSPLRAAAGPPSRPPAIIAQDSVLARSDTSKSLGLAQQWSAARDTAQVDLADELIALISSQQAADEFFAMAAKTGTGLRPLERQTDQ